MNELASGVTLSDKDKRTTLIALLIVFLLAALDMTILSTAMPRIVAELEAAGALTRERDGRRNRYRLDTTLPLRHPLEKHRSIGDVLALVLGKGR